MGIVMRFVKVDFDNMSRALLKAMGKAVLLHEYVFRPPRPPFQYAPWMDVLANLDQQRRLGYAARDHLIDGNALREAYEAGLRGDLDAVESFVGLCDLANEED